MSRIQGSAVAPATDPATRTGAFLALDQGGHGSRALLVAADGGRLLASFEDRVPIRTDGVRAEQDAAALLESLRRVAARACAVAGVRVHAAGLATQRSPVLCWRPSRGEALGPVLGWQDRRAADRLPKAPEVVAEIERRTGLVVSAHYGATKLRWCLDHLEPVARARREGDLVMGPLSAFLLGGLTGSAAPAVDAINASRTLLLSRDTLNWDPWLLERFGVPVELLPRVQPALSDFGVLQGCGVPLKLVTGDQSAVPFAYGPPDPDTLYLNLGTGAFLQRVPGPEAPRPPLLENPLPGPPWRAMEGTVNGAAAALDAHAGCADWADRLDALLSLPEDAPLFLNAVGGLGSPDWRHDIESSFAGEPELALRPAIVAESIAFLVRRNLDAMHAQHPPPTRILASGGLAGSDALCQVLADLCGVPVLRPPSTESTALGVAALLGASMPDPERAGGRWFRPRSGDARRRRFARWSAALALGLWRSSTDQRGAGP
jgi:glycerol kinase